MVVAYCRCIFLFELPSLFQALTRDPCFSKYLFCPTGTTGKNVQHAGSAKRSTAACPANQTGKLLSPRKIMMDTRDRMEEAGKSIGKDGKFQEDGKTLLHNYITTE